MSGSKKEQYQVQVDDEEEEDDEQSSKPYQMQQKVEADGQLVEAQQKSKQFEPFEFESTAAAEGLGDPYSKKASKNQQDATAASSTSMNQKKKRATRLRATKIVHSAQDLEIGSPNQQQGDDESMETSNAVQLSQRGKTNNNTNLTSGVALKGNLPCLDTFVHRKVFKAQVQAHYQNAVLFGKGQEIEINEDGKLVFQVKKSPKKTRGLIEYLTQSATRYVYLKDCWLYVLRKVSSTKYVVCSYRELSALFKIYENRQNNTELRLCFLNKERNPLEQPVLKQFHFDTASALQNFVKVLSARVILEGYTKVHTEN